VARSAGPPAAAARELKPTGGWRRLLALLLDYVVILAWMTFLGLLSFLTYVVLGSLPDTVGTLGPFGSQVLYFFLLTFVVGVYLYRCESGPHHSTWGERRMGLAVVGVDGMATRPRRPCGSFWGCRLPLPRQWFTSPWWCSQAADRTIARPGQWLFDGPSWNSISEQWGAMSGMQKIPVPAGRG
jgi:hypothetical protein